MYSTLHPQDQAPKPDDSRRGVLEQRPLFQVVVLKNDEQESVLVSEVQEVDFRDIDKHLQRGDSIFITSVPSQKLTAADHQETSVALDTLQTHSRYAECIDILLPKKA
jgi:hypothetical protein